MSGHCCIPSVRHRAWPGPPTKLSHDPSYPSGKKAAAHSTDPDNQGLWAGRSHRGPHSGRPHAASHSSYLSGLGQVVALAPVLETQFPSF